jgi:battenin
MVNSKFLITVQHKYRIMAVTCLMVTGFMTIAICCFYDTISAMFWLSLLASILVGLGQALGESVTLGFLKTFPGDAISYFGSGTGFAGISGSLIFIALKPLGFSDQAIYLIVIPTAIPYLLSFLWLNKQKVKYPYIPEPSEN